MNLVTWLALAGTVALGMVGLLAMRASDRRMARDLEWEAREKQREFEGRESARLTPSSQGAQRWDTAVMTERDRLVEFARVWQPARRVVEVEIAVDVRLGAQSCTDDPTDQSREVSGDDPQRE